VTAIIIALGLLLLLCIGVLIALQDFGSSKWQTRRELNRLTRQQSARKAWERMIKADW